MFGWSIAESGIVLSPKSRRWWYTTIKVWRILCLVRQFLTSKNTATSVFLRLTVMFQIWKCHPVAHLVMVTPWFVCDVKYCLESPWPKSHQHTDIWNAFIQILIWVLCCLCLYMWGIKQVLITRDAECRLPCAIAVSRTDWNWKTSFLVKKISTRRVIEWGNANQYGHFRSVNRWIVSQIAAIQSHAVILAKHV